LDKNKLFMIIIIGLLVVLLGFVGWFIMFGMPKLSGEPEVVYLTPAPEKILTAQDITTHDLSNSLKSNLAVGADGKKHFIQVELSVGIDKTAKDQAKILTAVQENESLIRDFAVGILLTKTYEEMETSEGREAFRKELLARIQTEFATETIVNVNMPFYVTQ